MLRGIFLIVMLSIPVQGMASDHYDNDVFKHTSTVKRMYSAWFLLQGCDEVTFEAYYSTASADPVFFLRNGQGEQLAMDDDSGEGLKPKLSYRIAECGSGNANTPTTLAQVESPTVMTTPINQNEPVPHQMVRLDVLSYDSDFFGTLGLEVRTESRVLTRMNNIRFGSHTVWANWEQGDKIRTTSAIEAVTGAEACASLVEDPLVGQADFNRVEQTCDLRLVQPGSASSLSSNVTTLTANEICSSFSGLPSQSRRFYFDYNVSKCSTSARFNDSMVFAMANWTKEPSVSIERTCRWRWDWRTRRARRVCYSHAVYEEPEFETIALDDDSGHGTWSALSMPTTEQGEHSAFIIALHPWSTEFYKDPSEEESPLIGWPSEYFHIYRDRIRSQGEYRDTDFDGISTALENIIGTSPTNPDHDSDGLIDGLEVYGAAGLPLPVLGATAFNKTMVLEIDSREEFAETASNYNKQRAYRYAARAFSEAGWEMIVLDGDSGFGLNANPIIDENVWGLVGDENDAEALKRISTNSQTNQDFDLRGYDFVRRVVWTHDVEFHSQSCGIATESVRSDGTQTGYGRYIVLGCPGTTLTHELGHSVGLSHGGRDKRPYKPNHWSVMSYGPQYPIAEDLNGDGSSDGLSYLYTEASKKSGKLRRRPAYFSNTKLGTLNEASLSEQDGVYYEHPYVRVPFTFEAIHPRSVEEDVTSLPNSTVFFDYTPSWLNWNGSDTTLDDGRELATKNIGHVSVNIDGSCKELEDSFGVAINRYQDEYAIDPATGALREGNTVEEACIDVLESIDEVEYLENLDLSLWSSGIGVWKQRFQMQVTSLDWYMWWANYQGLPELPQNMTTQSVVCK